MNQRMNFLRVRLPGDAGILSLDTFNDPASPPPALGSSVTVSFPPTGFRWMSAVSSRI